MNNHIENKYSRIIITCISCKNLTQVSLGGLPDLHSSFTGWTPRSSEVWLNSQRINMHIWNEKQKKIKWVFLYFHFNFGQKNPYSRLDNFPFFSSDFPVRNFSPTNFPFSRFSWENAMPSQGTVFCRPSNLFKFWPQMIL